MLSYTFINSLSQVSDPEKHLVMGCVICDFGTETAIPVSNKRHA